MAWSPDHATLPTGGLHHRGLVAICGILAGTNEGQAGAETGHDGEGTQI